MMIRQRKPAPTMGLHLKHPVRYRGTLRADCKCTDLQKHFYGDTPNLPLMEQLSTTEASGLGAKRHGSSSDYARSV